MAINKREAQRIALGIVGGLLAGAGGLLMAQVTDPTHTGIRLPPVIEVVTDGEVHAEECVCDMAKAFSGTPRRPNRNMLVYEFDTDWIDKEAFFWFAVFATPPISIVSVRAVSP